MDYTQQNQLAQAVHFMLFWVEDWSTVFCHHSDYFILEPPVCLFVGLSYMSIIFTHVGSNHLSSAYFGANEKLRLSSNLAVRMIFFFFIFPYFSCVKS